MMLGKMELLRSHGHGFVREKSILLILRDFQGFQCLRATSAKFKKPMAAALGDEVSIPTNTLAGKMLSV